MTVRASDGPAESGITLIEVLLTVVIMGLAFSAILGGIAVFHRSSATHRDTAELDRALRTYADSVAAASYVGCAASYNVTAPSGYSPSIAVKYWDGAANATYSSSCPASDKGAQQVAVSLSKNGRQDTLYIVKRR